MNAPPTATPVRIANRPRGSLSGNIGTMTSAAENSAASTIQRMDQARLRMFFQSACSMAGVLQPFDLGGQPVIDLDFLRLLPLDAVKPDR